MDSAGPGGLTIIFILLLAVDIVVYGFSSALRALKHEEEDEDEDRKKREARARALIQKALKDQSDYLDTISTVTAVVNLLYGAVFAGAIAKWLCKIWFHSASGAPLVLCYVISILCILILTESIGMQVPRRLASAHPAKWADRTGRAVLVLLRLFLPLIRLVSVISRGILYIMGVRGTSLEGDVTEEEILSIVNEGHEQGVIQQTEAEMITNIFEFSDKEAHDIMTNRSDIIGIDADSPLEKASSFMTTCHNSRFPVYEENIDTITGIVHVRDALRYLLTHPEEKDVKIGSIKEILRDAVYVPETKNIDDLFRQMQKNKLQMVIVIDEYGQTAGIVSMEDILEEIVGNIMDEYDVDENYITATGNKNEYIIDGRTPLEDLQKKFGIRFDDDRFETLNGFLMSEMDRVPEPDCHFTCEYGGYRFRVLSVADRQVQRVLLTRL